VTPEHTSDRKIRNTKRHGTILFGCACTRHALLRLASLRLSTQHLQPSLYAGLHRQLVCLDRGSASARATSRRRSYLGIPLTLKGAPPRPLPTAALFPMTVLGKSARPPLILTTRKLFH
jgi:hypothetical protein